jgi:hypothetical protein
MSISRLLSGAKGKLAGYQIEFKDFIDCACMAFIGASPGLMLYELHLPENLCFAIAATGAALTEIAYAKYSDRITEALAPPQSYQPYLPQQVQFQGTL